MMSGEYPTLKLPVLPTQASQSTIRKPPQKRREKSPLVQSTDQRMSESEHISGTVCDKVVCTDIIGTDIEHLLQRVEELEHTVEILTKQVSPISIRSIAHNDRKVAFYTGFPTYDGFMTCYHYLGPPVNDLI